MNNERDMIRLMDGILPQSPERLSKLMESDAELIQLNENTKFLFSIDEFSEEDQFHCGDPRTLGWNLAVGAVSDILAAGGLPRFFSHAVVTGPDWDEQFVKNFTHGVADALAACGASFMAGDFGRSNQWRYTAAVIGELAGKKLTRMGGEENHGIYISGRIGAGNLGAAVRIFADKKRFESLTRYMIPKLPLRLEETRLIRRFASSCIDTSDGVFNALNTLADVNGTGYAIENLPYLKRGMAAAKILSLTPLLLLMGECGEYELLFTVPPDAEPQFLAEANLKGRRFYRLGAITAGERVLVQDSRRFSLENLDIRARDFDEPKAYIKTMVETLTKAGLHG